MAVLPRKYIIISFINRHLQTLTLAYLLLKTSSTIAFNQRRLIHIVYEQDGGECGGRETERQRTASASYVYVFCAAQIGKVYTVLEREEWL